MAAHLRFASPVVSPVRAGRNVELSLLDAAFQEAAGGRTRTVLIAGEAGGGKSRLTKLDVPTRGAAASAHRLRLFVPL